VDVSAGALVERYAHVHSPDVAAVGLGEDYGEARAADFFLASSTGSSVRIKNARHTEQS